MRQLASFLRMLFGPPKGWYWLAIYLVAIVWATLVVKDGLYRAVCDALYFDSWFGDWPLELNIGSVVVRGVAIVLLSNALITLLQCAADNCETWRERLAMGGIASLLAIGFLPMLANDFNELGTPALCETQQMGYGCEKEVQEQLNEMLKGLNRPAMPKSN